MKSLKYAAAALASTLALSVNVSCLKTVEPETSPQAAIRSMSLGNFYVRMNDVNVQHRDTIVMSYQGGAMYPMTIDQLSNRIYNVDSLAAGSQLTSVTCSFTSTGTVVYRYADEEELEYHAWSSSDPIDFTRPLKFCAVSTDQSYIREYDFKLNIHTVCPDSVSWVSSDTVGYTVLDRAAAAVLGDTLYNFGIDGSGILSVSAHSTRSGNWSAPLPVTGITADGWSGSVSVFNDLLFTVSAGSLYSSSDALSWSVARSGVTAVVAAGNDSPFMWVRTDAGLLSMTADLNTWACEQPVPAGFPDSIAAAFTYPLATNSGICRTVLAGKNGSEAAVWTVLSNDTVWHRVSTAPYSSQTLPDLQQLAIVRYDGSLFAFGTGFEGFWQSPDNGTNWLWCDRYYEDYSSYNNFMQFPDALKGNLDTFSYATDNVGCIWIMTRDGQVWRGSINRLNRR